MKSKEELIKQVIILGIILFAVIIIAVCLNMGKNKNKIEEITVRNNNSIYSNTNQEKEMKDNLKGLLDTSTENEFEDSGTIKEPIETGIKEELRTVNNEIVQYQEIWNGDN